MNTLGKPIEKSRYFPILVFVVVGLLSLLANVLLHESICLFIRIFGVPSPACGMTRAYISLMQGDIREAMLYHPLFWLPPLICLLAWFRRLSERIIFISLFLLLGVWVTRLITMFPHQVEPMVYNPNAVVPTIIRKIVMLFN